MPYEDHSDRAVRLLGRQLVPAAEAFARITRDAIVEGMDPGPVRTGSRYYVPGTRTEYTASAEGDARAPPGSGTS